MVVRWSISFDDLRAEKGDSGYGYVKITRG